MAGFAVPDGGTREPETRREREGAGQVVLVVDARGLLESGIGRYLREVLSYLFRDSRFAEIRLLGDPAALQEFCRAVKAVETARILAFPFGFYSARAQLAWLTIRPRVLAGADVVFFPHYDVPVLGPPPQSVVTIHDLTHFNLPEYFSWWRRLVAGVLLERSVSRAARVAVHSFSTARDLAARYPGVAAKTRVVPLAASEIFARREPGSPGMPEGITGPYLLCVGNRKPHKNLNAAVETLARARHVVPELRLVCVGTVYPEWREVLARAAALGLSEALVDLPTVSDGTLRLLYQNCSALLFLSRYEGFGLPVLEAMASGAPVIASTCASLPEVVGDAGILVHPDDPDAAAAAVLRILRDRPHADDLRRKGAERAKLFSWADTGRATADLLVEAAGAPMTRRRG